MLSVSGNQSGLNRRPLQHQISINCEEQKKKKELLLTFLLFSAENVKYQVNLRGETWENSLAELGSTRYAELADRIKKAVNISLLLFLFVIF